MEPESSLPCSLKPSIVPYPETAESSSPHLTLSPKVQLNFIFQPTPMYSQRPLIFEHPNKIL